MLTKSKKYTFTFVTIKLFTFVIANLNHKMTTKEYLTFKQKKISGRYITLKNIKPLINNLPEIFKVIELGKSFLGQSIYKIKIGTGKKRILIWSQMHGNETTGTKAIFDLCNYLNSKEGQSTILKACTIVIVPMLNPDGAMKFTRVNAQDIDLNRDAVALKAPESKLLHDLLYNFKPNYCFNLHDQRPIFSVGKANNPATISFLAPSVNEARDLTDGRKETMRIIVAMYLSLKKHIPNQIGRYTDEFYPKATGDNFQKAGFNTILIEAGHYKGDYFREKTRKYNFLALLSGVNAIYSSNNFDYTSYFNIPNNETNYYDTIYKNVCLNGQKKVIGVFLKPIFKNNSVKFIPNIKILENTTTYNADNTEYKEFNFSSIDKLNTFLQNAHKK